MKQAVLVKLIIPQLIFFLSSTFQNDRWGTKRPLISSWMETSTKPERSQFALASGRLLVVNYCLSVFISSLLFFFLIYSGILNRENYESAVGIHAVAKAEHNYCDKNLDRNLFFRVVSHYYRQKA